MWPPKVDLTVARGVQIQTRRRLGVLCAVPLAFSLLFFLVNQQAERTNLGIVAAQDVSNSFSALFSLTQDAETGQRGFLLTGDERYLVPYQQAASTIQARIDICRALIRDRPEVRDDAEHVFHLVEQKFADIASVLAAQQQGGFTAALDRLKEGRGQQLMEELRGAVHALQTKIGNTQRLRDRQLMISYGAFAVFLVGVAVMILVLAGLYHSLLGFIQAREATQAQLEALNLELEHRIDERTRELQMSNEELQQFAYVASHDLQEPLRTITSFAQLLASRYQGRLDADADEFINYIVTSARRMTDLIEGLLALVRLRKAGQSAQPAAFEQLLSDAKADLQALIRETGARIEHGPLPALAVDRVQITQLLENLLSNAIKYRRPGVAPVITVSAQRHASEWVIAVADNGQGFEQQYAERIFGVFQRLHNREIQGTGIGLSIARKVVERHGGRIWAKSTPGEGSTFYLSLPVSLEVDRRIAELGGDLAALGANTSGSPAALLARK